MNYKVPKKLIRRILKQTIKQSISEEVIVCIQQHLTTELGSIAQDILNDFNAKDRLRKIQRVRLKKKVTMDNVKNGNLPPHPFNKSVAQVLNHPLPFVPLGRTAESVTPTVFSRGK